MNRFHHLLEDESGATAIEYGLIASATGLALAAAMPTLGSNITSIYSNIADALTTAASG